MIDEHIQKEDEKHAEIINDWEKQRELEVNQKYIIRKDFIEIIELPDQIPNL